MSRKTAGTQGRGRTVLLRAAPSSPIPEGIATMSIGTFIGAWNNYLMPLVLLLTPEKFTLPVMMASLRASVDMNSNVGATYLTVAISVLPVMVAFMFFSKYIISSISAGGVKE